MSDEFEGSHLDMTKWWSHNPHWLGRRPALFVDENVHVSDGKLNLMLRKQSPYPKAPEDGYHTYTSAAVQSKTRVKYGYFEIKAKPMRSRNISAFWFYYQDGEEWTEIDVYEIGGDKTGRDMEVPMNLHVFWSPTVRKHFERHETWKVSEKLTEEFHTYGLEWDEKKIVFYFDGEPIRIAQNTHWHQALTLNIDAEIFEALGLPEEHLPATYSIEYVRAWKKPGQDRDPLPGFPPNAPHLSAPTSAGPKASTSPTNAQ